MSGSARSGLRELIGQNLPGDVDLLQALLANSPFGWVACEIRMPSLTQAIDDLLYSCEAGVWGDAHTQHLQGISAGGRDRVTPCGAD